jgi:ankyrin repeat protein
MVQEQPIKRQRSISERPIVRDSDSFIDDDNINEQEEEEEEEEVYYASTTNKQKRRQQCHFTSPEPNSPSSKAVTRRKTYANPNKRDHKIGRTPIYKAARNGHLEQVKALVEAGAHVNITDNANWTPLHEAAESCQFEVAQYLMECGAKVNVRGHESTTPLHDACIAKDAHAAALVVKLLVDGGANAFAMNNRHQRPIDLCIEKNNEACQAILQARIMELEHDIIQKDSQGKSLLHYACYNNKYEKAQDLIKKGADVNCQDNQDITPLQLACAQGHLDIVKLLIEQGGALLDLLDNTENGDSPLHYASRNGRKNIVEYLLNQAKAEVNIRNKQDQDAYHVSAAHPPVRQILTAKMDESKYEELAIDSLDDNARGLKKQIEPERPLTREERKIQKEMESFEKMEGRSFSSDNKADNFIDDNDTSTTKRRTKRQTTRSASVQERDIVTATKNNKISASRSATPTENVKLDLLKRDASNSTNLHIFAGQDDCGKMGYLLNKDVDPNVKNNYGWTPLHEASLKGKVNAVKMLLKYGADVDAKSRDKDTPLHDAVENNQCQVVELLLEYGADLFAKNRHGADSIEIATQHGFQDILLVLRKKQKMILGEDYDEDEQVDLKCT